MKHRAVDGLAARFGLPAGAAAPLASLLELLAGDSLAPTTLRDPRAILDDHLADSLVALELQEVRAASRVADLGAGAGLPGLPLAIALPAARVTLVESNGRKCDFLRRAVTACGLDNVDVVAARAEAWEPGIGRCDLVTARALAPLPVVAEYAAPLLAVGGALVAWRGRRDPSDEAAGARAAAAPRPRGPPARGRHAVPGSAPSPSPRARQGGAHARALSPPSRDGPQAPARRV